MDCLSIRQKNNKTLETASIESLLLCSYNRLWRYAYSLTHNSDRADDLMQDTALRILIAGDKFKRGTDFENWARVVMRNSFINGLNHDKRLLAMEETDLIDTLGNGSVYSHTFDTVGSCRDIYNAVESLPLGRRETMMMFMHGHKYTEIAFVTNVPLGTVKSRINSSRIFLKDVLKDYLQ